MLKGILKGLSLLGCVAALIACGKAGGPAEQGIHAENEAILLVHSSKTDVSSGSAETEDSDLEEEPDSLDQPSQDAPPNDPSEGTENPPSFQSAGLSATSSIEDHQGAEPVQFNAQVQATKTVETNEGGQPYEVNNELHATYTVENNGSGQQYEANNEIHATYTLPENQERGFSDISKIAITCVDCF